MLGSTKEEELSDDELAQLRDEILHLYYDDYIEQWELLLVTSPSRRSAICQHSVDVLKAVAGDSPIKLLLHAIVRETGQRCLRPRRKVAKAVRRGSPGALKAGRQSPGAS